MLNLDKKQKYLLACSFGPDSMALFAMLLKEGFSFEVALVNYHLRKESDSEEDSLKRICDKNNIKLHTLRVNDLKGKTGIEEKARKIRYRFFAELTKKYNYFATLVAHHQDDLLETYLMQKQRGNLVKHYGLKYENFVFGINVVRPLLNYSKQELLEYCNNNHIQYSIDSTNKQDTYLRNKIRHNIVEKLTEKERNNFLVEINKENQRINQIIQHLNSIDLNSVSEVLKLPNDSLCYALNFLAQSVIDNPHLSKKLCLEIKNVLISSKPNITFKINDKISLLKEYGHFYFVSGNNSPCQYAYIVNIFNKKLDTPYFFLDFNKESENRNVHDTDYPLTIRNVHPSDIVKVKGYYVKARRLLIDWKMPLSLRKRWPVIVNNQNTVIYIPRYQADFVKDKTINFYVK